ncbi:sensor histidine kinase [Ferrimicrobium sp.]|uniref:sensor histidine kinase n=1 Tax=Ferrimicrobium sp. TaxID=2926050 RepID=UPI00262D8822|nr:sensor histidine kinase [Ferrimicrobium sp.]
MDQDWHERVAPVESVTLTWGRVALPLLFLAYCAQVAGGVFSYGHGVQLLVGLGVLTVFGGLYIALVFFTRTTRRYLFFSIIGAMLLCFVIELPIARDDALIMLLFILAPIIGRLKTKAWPFIALAIVGSYALPFAEPSWGATGNLSMPLTILLASVIVLAFSQLVRTNCLLVETRDELDRVVREGERLRIARDLHDVLGHSLTSITIKAELATKTFDRDPERSRTEMSQVEALARQSLADVRATVAGYYMSRTMVGELEAAQELLSSAGVELTIDRSGEEPSPGAAELFGWVIRESVTNVVRHAHATNCTIRLRSTGISVQDDGCGGEATFGCGLAGLAERAARAGGSLDAGPGSPCGWQVELRIPVRS